MKIVLRCPDYRPAPGFAKPRFSLRQDSPPQPPSSTERKNYHTINIEQLARRQRMPQDNQRVWLKKGREERVCMAELLDRLDKQKQGTRTALSQIVTIDTSTLSQEQPLALAHLTRQDKKRSRSKPSTARKLSLKTARPQPQRKVMSQQKRKLPESRGEQFGRRVQLLGGLDRVIRGHSSKEEYEQRALQEFQSSKASRERAEAKSGELALLLQQMSKDMFEQRINLGLPTRGLLDQIDAHRHARLAKARLRYRPSSRRLSPKSRPFTQKASSEMESQYPSKCIALQPEQAPPRQQSSRSPTRRYARRRRSIRELIMAVREVLLRSCRPSSRPYELAGSFSFFYAIEGGKAAMVLMLERTPEYMYSVNELGQTPLIVAVLKGAKDSLQEMLRYRGPRNHRDCYGRSALHYAAKSGQLECVKLLLQARANPWSKEGCPIEGDQDCMLLVRNARKAYIALSLGSVLDRQALWLTLLPKIDLIPYFS